MQEGGTEGLPQDGTQEQKLSIDTHPFGCPVTILICIILIKFWFIALIKKIRMDAIGINYNNFIKKQEWWRIFTSSVIHFNVPHLLINLMSIWSCRELEYTFSSIKYLYIIFLLVCIPKFFYICFLHFLIAYPFIHRLGQLNSVGFSDVIFGLTVILSLNNSTGYVTVLLLFRLPAIHAPLLTMIITQIISPQLSPISNFSGYIVGHLFSFGLFDWLFQPISIFFTFLWVFAGLLYSVRSTTSISVPFITYAEPFQYNIFSDLNIRSETWDDFV